MRHDQPRIHLILLACDLLLVIGGLTVAIGWNLGRDLPAIDPALLLLYAPVLLCCFDWSGAYAVPVTVPLREWWRTGINGLLLFCLVLVTSIYAIHLEPQFPRLALLTWLIFSTASVLGLRVGARLLQVRRGRDHGAIPVVLAGNVAMCHRFREHLHDHPETGLRCVAIVSDEAWLPVDGLPSGTLAEIAHVAQETGSSRVVVCTRIDEAGQLDAVMASLLPYPFEIYFAPDFSRMPLFCLNIEDSAGYPLIHLTGSPMTRRDLVVKRIEDLVISVVILALISWLLLLIALAIKLTSRGPALFIQNRHGLMGKTIQVWKFRTMIWSPRAQAENRPESADAGSRESLMHPATGMFRKTVRGDARVTRIGGFLRRTSLDELPQFFNVITGSMSIVGPRPHARLHNLQFLPDVPLLMRRHYVKPGITGLAQINGARGETRSSQDMHRRVALDLQYIRSWSLGLDLQIITETVFKGFWTRQP